MTPAATSEPADGLPSPRRYWAVASIWMVVTVVVLDSAVANVALPTIAREFGAPPATAIWIVNAYQLAITVALLPLAALGERFGYRRINLIGVAVFTLASLACAAAGSTQTLVLARVIQGLGGAFIMATNIAIFRFVMPQRILGRMLGINAVVVALSSASGPTVASLILSVASWRWLFAVNVPIGLLAFCVALRNLPRTPGQDRPFDVVAAILNASTFGFLILGAESLAEEGLAQGLWKLGVGVASAVLLTRRELRRPHPLVPFDLLRIPMFSLSIATSILSFTAQMIAFVTMPFFLQTGLGLSVVQTGLLITPWPLAVAVAAPLAGHLADRYPAGLLSAAGLAVMAVGLAALALLHPGASGFDILWPTVLGGVGFGFFQAPNNRAIILSTPRQRSGATGGMLATARLLGQTLGALSVAVAFHMAGVGGSGAVLGFGAAIACLGAVASLSRLRIPPSPDPSLAQEPVA